MGKDATAHDANTADATSGASRRAFLLTVLLSCLTVGLGFWAWDRWQPQISAADEYRLTPAKIRLSEPPPAALPQDFKAEVIASANLENELSLLSPNLAERLAKAFALHAWVESVDEVTVSFPAEVVVKLSYRQPAVAVSIVKDSQYELIPVDANAVRLPAAQIPLKELRHLPRVRGELDGTANGQQISQPGLRGAIELAVWLAPAWQELSLTEVHQSQSPPTMVDGEPQFQYELVSRGGSQIVWGRLPKREQEGEPPAADKLARLREIEHLDSISGPRSVNLASPGE